MASITFEKYYEHKKNDDLLTFYEKWRDSGLRLPLLRAANTISEAATSNACGADIIVGTFNCLSRS